MRRNYYIFFLIHLSLQLCLYIITSCNDGEESKIVPSSPSEIIGIQTQVLKSRGTPIDKADSLKSIGIFCAYTGLNNWSASSTLCKMFNKRMNNVDKNWVYEGDPVGWDYISTSDKYSFFAYTPFATGVQSVNNPTGNGIVVQSSLCDAGVPTITYTVPENVVAQPDLMVAMVKDQTPIQYGVPLRMEHMLTSVGFNIIGKGEQITSISISGVATTGTRSLDPGSTTWQYGEKTSTNFSSSINFDAGKDYYTATMDISTDLMKSDGYLMMIPQILDNSAKVIVGIKNKPNKEISLAGQPEWRPGIKVTYTIYISGQGTVIVSPSLLNITYANIGITDSITVTTTPNDGSVQWSLTTQDPWLTMTTDKNSSSASQNIEINGNTKIYLKATDNPSQISKRSSTIFLDNRTDSIKCTINQAFLPLNSAIPEYGSYPVKGPIPYVGAFWRYNERGERIISFKAGADSTLGAWTAKVFWVGESWSNDKIVLSTKRSNDPLVNTSSPGSAESYLVNDTFSIVTGKVEAGGSFYFRIGLTGIFQNPTPDIPVRYAVVLLSYNNNTRHHKLFLRQGEDPDYLFKPTEKYKLNETGEEKFRTYSRRFSPYNLTATTFKQSISSSNPAIFTQYPTQPGALFQWYNESPFYKFAYPQFGAQLLSTEYNVKVFPKFWSDIKSTYEIAPQGYSTRTNPSVNFRRPRDGEKDNVIYQTIDASYSEIRQSLFVNVVSGARETTKTWMKNYWHGYYADGYFDRRLLDATGFSVSAANNQIACMGAVFINSATNTSIFWPSGGSRHKDTFFKAQQIGEDTKYWTSTNATSNKDSINTCTYWYLNILRNFSGINNINRVLPSHQENWNSGTGYPLTKGNAQFGYYIRPVIDQ